MKATLTKIHPLKLSRNGNSFIRVEFQLEDGSWAKTDLCPTYRNYSRWTSILKQGAGVSLTNLRLKKKGEVDADSFPSITTITLKTVEEKKPEPIIQPKLL